MSTITRAALHQLLENREPHLLIDTCIPETFHGAHLPGAANCCVYEMTFIDQVAEIAPDKAAYIIVYGSSAHSLASATAQEKLARAGYTNARDYRGGLEDWEAAGLPIERGPVPPPPPKPREGRHELDLEKSRVFWTGRNINGAHTGTVALKSGWLHVTGAHNATGDFTLDMTSIANLDLADTTLNRILITHLKSDDFFDTALHPTATFQLRHVTLNRHARPGAINADIDGALTLKGITEGLGFPAIIEVLPGGNLSAEAHFDIDRTRWNVIYGSGKFYEKLGQHLVHDHISLSLHLLTI